MAATDTVLRRDDNGFSALLAQHIGIVRKVATTYCRDADDRADLAQEIAAHLWQAWPGYDHSRPFSTWMYRVAFNVAISHVRGVYRRERHFVSLSVEHEQVPDAPADHEGSQLLATLSALLHGLDGLNRALLLLYLDGRSHREISEILGIGESNVGTKVSRLKERLRAQLSASNKGDG